MLDALTGKRILITGGAGAFGRSLASALRTSPPASLTVLSRDEMKHAAMKREFTTESKTWLNFRLGDITVQRDLQKAFKNIDLVIHAAAMKHLPECELNLSASNRVNVIGTENIADTFLESAAETLVFLSTDKAPYATSVYGAQKYLGEKIISEVSRHCDSKKKRAFSMRYSNVMDSTGSVFHLFKEILSQGKTATVNGTSMCRGFISQKELQYCINKALNVSLGGETFVLKPRVIKISDLAIAMQKIIGKGDVEVRNSVSFAGEKDSATLVTAEEASYTKVFTQCDLLEAFIIDPLSRQTKKEQSGNPQHQVSLEHCSVLKDGALERFVTELLGT